MEARSDLIYDVGLFDGGDTAYYLFRGYNVVAIDANPLMIEKARSRFSEEIRAKRLTLLNVGISNTPGTETFWISHHPEWSSFDRTIASRAGVASESVSVSTVPFSEILAEHGVPHYLKIDIEGHDQLCVDALKGMLLPKYISVESECAEDARTLSEKDAIAMLELLRDVGYRRFKLVKQSTWTSVRSNFIARSCLSLVTSVAQGRLQVRGLSRIAYKFTDSARVAAASGFVFSQGCTGPWGEDVPGGWMTFDKARGIYLRRRRAFFLRKQKLYSLWYDWHATY
jgi:FkbM family methyltransferase